MKNLLLLFTIIAVFGACSNPSQSEEQTNSSPKIELTNYPTALQKVFEKHGSLASWQKMKSMSYEMVDTTDGNEIQKIDLQNRREYIAAPNFKTGYDGKEFWVKADTSYKGNPVFYHNLMFYFYAMPFVLADDGIVYGETEPLVFEEKSYPGIRISYNDGVGVSSKDEYFIHYDPATFEMTWLGYTVTYFSKEVSKKVKWIRYDDWKKVEGLLLPNSMTWYKLEEGQPIEPRSTQEFVKVVVSETALGDEIFAPMEGSRIVE